MEGTFIPLKLYITQHVMMVDDVLMIGKSICECLYTAEQSDLQVHKLAVEDILLTTGSRQVSKLLLKSSGKQFWISMCNQ